MMVIININIRSMKKNYLLLAFIATAYFVCSCGEQKATIPLYEVENGDTIAIQHEITASEVSEMVFEGYNFDEDGGSATLKYLREEDIPSDLELMGFLLYCGVEDDSLALNAFKASVQQIKIDSTGVEGELFTYMDGDDLDLYYINKAYPHLSLGIDAKKEAFDLYFKEMEKNAKQSNFSESQISLITILSILNAKTISHYYTGRSFKSESGIVTRLLTTCELDK